MTTSQTAADPLLDDELVLVLVLELELVLELVLVLVLELELELELDDVELVPPVSSLQAPSNPPIPSKQPTKPIRT